MTEPEEVVEEADAEAEESAGEEVGAIAQLTRERDEYLDLAQRARAEFDNYRKRSALDVRSAELRGKAGLAKDLLPAIDNLERALQAAGFNSEPAEDTAEPESREVSAHEALAAGVALVQGELARALASAGVEAFDPHGQEFDPATCEALSTRPAADGETANTVVETLQRGYRIGATLIRPARVVVAS